MPHSVIDNRGASIRLIGRHKRPVVVLDNAHPDPQSLREAAFGRSFASDPHNFYPGVRAPAPAEYIDFLSAQLKRFRSVFDPQAAQVKVATSLYSLPATPVARLRPIQCVPHIDTHNTGHIAAVHYLCDHTGGTSFYRHRETGTEYLLEENIKEYFARVKQQMIERGTEDLTYINGSDTLFERIERIPAEFNRLILYPANNLHAGDISAGCLSDNPRLGRLSINSYCTVLY